MVNGPDQESVSMNRFPAVTDAELARARNDAAFRQKLLQHSLDALLNRLQKERRPRMATASDAQMREGVDLAVKLAELIQATADTLPNKP
jgi:hypothetical protein